MKHVGKLCQLNRSKVEHAEAYFNRHGRSSTFIGRLITGIRHLISISAGLAKMNIKKFILYTALGSGIWHIILATLSYFLYSQQDLLMKYMHGLSFALLACGALFVFYLIWKYRRKKNRLLAIYPIFEEILTSSPSTIIIKFTCERNLHIYGVD